MSGRDLGAVSGCRAWIEIDNASRRVNLDQIRMDPAVVVADVRYEGDVYTTGELADRVGVTPRALNLIVGAMREAGRHVGLRPDVSIYTDRAEAAIRQ